MLVLSVVVASVVVLFAPRAAGAACSSPVVGTQLTTLRTGLRSLGVKSADACFLAFREILSSSSAQPPSAVVTTFNLTLSLASLSASGECSGVNAQGARVLANLVACNCTIATLLPCSTSCFTRHQADLMSLSSAVLTQCNSSAELLKSAGFVQTRLPGALEFSSLLVGLLTSSAAVNGVTATLVSMTQLQDSTVSNVMQSSLSSGDSLVIACSAMFPTCSAAEALPTCPKVCQRVKPAIDVFALFANTSRIPITAVLVEAFEQCAPQNSSLPLTCVGLNQAGFLAIVNQTVRNVTRSGLCLNLTCPFPLRATTNEQHWNKDLQKLLFGIHSAIRRTPFLGDKSLAFNGSILPCGTDCVPIGVSDTDVTVAQVLLSVVSTMAAVVVFVSVLIFYFNRGKLAQRLVRRVLLLFTINGGLASLSFIPAAYHNHDAILCHSDGTLRLSEPGPGDPRCTLGTISSYFFVTITTGYFVALAHSWYRLIGALGQPNLKRQKTSIDVFYKTYKMDLVYAVLAVTPPLLLSIIVMALLGIEGNPIYGLCSISLTKHYYVGFFVAYFCVMCLLGCGFFFAGLRLLTAQRKGISGLVVWFRQRGRTGTMKPSLKDRLSRRKKKSANTSTSKTDLDVSASALPSTLNKEPKRFSGMARHEKRLKREINRLAFQILWYVLLGITNVVCTVVLGVYIGVKTTEWADATEAHILCRITSCQPETCTPLPEPQVAIILFPLVVQLVSLMLISGWTFSREFLVNVPLINRLPVFQRERSGTTSSSSGIDSADSPHSAGLKLVDHHSTPSSSPAASRDGTLKVAVHTNGSSSAARAVSPLAIDLVDSPLNHLVPNPNDTLEDSFENLIPPRSRTARSHASMHADVKESNV